MGGFPGGCVGALIALESDVAGDPVKGDPFAGCLESCDKVASLSQDLYVVRRVRALQSLKGGEGICEDERTAGVDINAVA